MLTVNCWDEISGEWQAVDLDIPCDSSPEAIVRAVDEATFAPLGIMPSEDLWTVKSHSRTGPLLTIECRTSRGILGIALVNYAENGLQETTGRNRVFAKPTGDHERA